MADNRGYTGLITGDLSRYMFALPLGVFGAFHFINAKNMVSQVPNWAPGNPVLWVYVSGAILAFGCLSFITGKYTYQAGVAVGTMLLGFAVLLHLPKAMSAGITVPSDHMTHFLKDFALASAAYFIAGRATY